MDALQSRLITLSTFTLYSSNKFLHISRRFSYSPDNVLSPARHAVSTYSYENMAANETINLSGNGEAKIRGEFLP